MKTGAIILAAGAASRFGSPKQLLKIGGETLVGRACRLASEAGFSPVICVLGANAERIQEGPKLGALITIHKDWANGMGASLVHGMRTLLQHDPEVEAVVILLCDQPGVDAELLGNLKMSLELTSIVLCDFGRTTGPPAAFSRVYFPELLALVGDQGAKAIAKAHPDSLTTISFPEGAWDIDSEEEWRKFNLSQSGLS